MAGEGAVFVGEDGNDNQEVHKFSVTTTKGTQAKYTLDSSADVTFRGFYDKNGKVTLAYADFAKEVLSNGKEKDAITQIR